MVQIAPAGGSRGLGAVRAYLTSRSPHDWAISVGDRDYDCSRAQADAGWAESAAHAYTWRRHEIENFLLHPPVLVALAADYRAAGHPWAGGWPGTEDEALALLAAVATPRLPNHAAGVLRAEVVRELSAVGSVQFGPSRPIDVVGAAAADEAAWVLVLQAEADRLGTALASPVAQAILDPMDIAARYRGLLAHVQSPTFLASGDFLSEMGGHELMSGLAAHLRTIGLPAGSSDAFLQDELLRTLDRVYQPGVTFQPDDFQDLAGLLGRP